MFMMKIKYISSFILPAILLFVACEDNLDTQPSGDTITSDQKEEVVSKDPSKAEAGVNAVFSQFSQYMPNEDALNAERHNDFGYPSVMLFTDHNGYDLVSDNNGYNWNGNNLEFSDRDYSSNESQILWNDMYSIIRASNSVISGIPADTDDPTLSFYLGQALSARAFSYWVLAQLYQFNYVGHQQDPCVPIITEENLEDAALNGLARSTVQEVYDLITSDLDNSIDLLKTAQDGGITRADKRYINLSVAYGLRARVNLTMQNWSEAAADATSAIESSSASPASIEESSRPSFMSINEPNWMWGIIISETDGVVTSGIVNWISHMGSLNWGYANYSQGKQINKVLYESISESDVRKGWWINEELESDNLNEDEQEFMAGTYPAYTQVKFAPYNNALQTTTNANDIPLMRIEEMYLIKAEAEGMSGGNGVNTLEDFIQTYRDPDYVYSGSDFQQEVFRHRRIELWGEGLNWFDIMRLETGVDRRGAGFPNANMIFNISADDPVLLWRIPEAEIQANPALSEGDNNPSAPSPKPVTE